MTELMRSLRCSTRMLLEQRAAAPRKGELCLVLARAGVGKTAFLTGVGLDALLAGERVLHVSLEANVEKVRDWYDDLLTEQLRRGDHQADLAAIHLEIERRRLIHSFLGRDFTVTRLEQTLEMLAEQMDFRPDLIVLDRLQQPLVDVETVGALTELARGHGAELWTSARTHREGPPPRPGHLPPPADRIEALVDLAFGLEPEGSRIRVHVLKDRGQITDRDLEIRLDPTTLLLTAEADAARC